MHIETVEDRVEELEKDNVDMASILKELDPLRIENKKQKDEIGEMQLKLDENDVVK